MRMKNGGEGGGLGNECFEYSVFELADLGKTCDVVQW
jgi:hypothetical protein